ncbi:MAG: cyclodeaminase/cyclohydrolase family protein [Planctomycetes bacterium]|nr:cyclodeaminase/cyclohydrolase family protein [Planctomycetota bacterium]
MMQQPFEKLVDSLAAKTPTPGGGAAAAMAGSLGTALFLMVVRFSKGKKANAEREGELAAVEQLLANHLERLKPMAERDCKSFDLVSAAYGMPKNSDGEKALRDKAIQEALVGAMVVPEEAMCMVRDVFVAMDRVADCVGKAIVSDLASGAALLLASAEGAFLNVRINAAFLANRELAESTMVRAKTVHAEILRHQEKIADQVEKMLA